MPSSRILAVLLVLTFGLGCASAQTLQVGDAFPHVNAKSLSGGMLVVPDGHRAVVILGFTQAAGKDSSSWSARIARDFPAVPVDNLIVLDKVPGLMRGMITSGIRHGMTGERQAHSAALGSEGAAWREWAAGEDLSHAVVFAVDGTGHIRSIVDGTVTEAGYARLRAALLATR